MALTRKQKEEILTVVKEKLKDQKSIVFTDFAGLSVTKMSELKKELRESGAEYKVIKKNILAKAIEESDISGLDMKSFDGSTGVAFSYDDEVAPAKVISKFIKGGEVGQFKITGGVLENKSMTKEEIIALAKLPSKEQLLANLLAQMNAPVSGFVNVLAGNIKNLVYALNAIKEKKA